MTPNFLRRNHENQIEQIDQTEPRTPENPFDRASADLAERWDIMIAERDNAMDAAERAQAENVWLSSEVDRLKKQLDTLTEFHTLEIERQTRRADAAVAREADMRGRLDLIGKAISGVIAETSLNPFAKRNQHDSVPPATATPNQSVITNITAFAAPRMQQAGVPAPIKLEDRHVSRQSFRVQADPDERDMDEDEGELSNLMDRVAGLHRL